MIYEEVSDELERLLRLQRHDFINHLQIIHALLEMGKTDRAMQYIEDFAKDNNMVPQFILQHTKPL